MGGCCADGASPSLREDNPTSTTPWHLDRSRSVSPANDKSGCVGVRASGVMGGLVRSIAAFGSKRGAANTSTT
eukprot:3625304-Prymnesium_polylepis.2